MSIRPPTAATTSTPPNMTSHEAIVNTSPRGAELVEVDAGVSRHEQP